MEGEGFLRSGHAEQANRGVCNQVGKGACEQVARACASRSIRSGERALLQRVRGGKYEESEHEGRRMRGSEHEAERSRGRCRASPSLRTKKCRMVTKKSSLPGFQGLIKGGVLL